MRRNKTFPQSQVFSFLSPETWQCRVWSHPLGAPAQHVPRTSRFPPGRQDPKPTTLWGHRTVCVPP